MTTTEVTKPGVYDQISDEAYHGDPVPGGSLSSSGARKLLETCPARFDYERRHPELPKKTFDIGHAAHKLVLGVGPHLEVVPGDRWDTKAAKEKVAEIRAAGGVPLKQVDHDHVTGMADAIRRHPIANALFHAGNGKPEQSLFWIDGDTSVWRRARTDWLPATGRGRLIVPDYKTCLSAHPDAVAKAVHNHGYYQQAAWYLDGIAAVGLDEDAAFVFVFQEKTPPYLVTVVELDAVALIKGRELNRQALRLYADCTTTGLWPGYADAHDIALISLPAWATRTEEYIR
ncbi:PD-(D/E)XK nuclease-like domain-containing protein [Micromonospora aurantiaca]|uniref:Putative exodeoxyribonuclease 8 PDDEXK-like domain-containing protein n=1 Tax=Micromonospora aurantiaca (nom. illeg.) TaxID=47850 RepID=A0A6N3JX29_9ACTN|nr:PD-(D/E)XK nuclease-like domain-containing protein [Micromonospora aurantiaca]AXH89436.1 hypothetical protein DVH21_05500 [Micromonospora aurantiaca]